MLLAFAQNKVEKQFSLVVFAAALLRSCHGECSRCRRFGIIVSIQTLELTV